MKDMFGRNNTSSLLLMSMVAAMMPDTTYYPPYRRRNGTSRNIHQLKVPEPKICALPCCWLEATPGKDYCCGEHCKLDKSKKKEIRLNNNVV